MLLLVALDMLRAQRSPVQERRRETAEGAAKDDIADHTARGAMLAGPAAISTILLTRRRRHGSIEASSWLALAWSVWQATASWLWVHPEPSG